MIPIFPSTDAITIIIPKQHIQVFKDMVQRATNTWDIAPPEIKTFADILIHGAALQDYSSQAYEKRVVIPTTPIDDLHTAVEELAICKECGGRGYHHMHTCPNLGKNKL